MKFLFILIGLGSVLVVVLFQLNHHHPRLISGPKEISLTSMEAELIAITEEANELAKEAAGGDYTVWTELDKKLDRIIELNNQLEFINKK